MLYSRALLDYNIHFQTSILLFIVQLIPDSIAKIVNAFLNFVSLVIISNQSKAIGCRVSVDFTSFFIIFLFDKKYTDWCCFHKLYTNISAA